MSENLPKSVWQGTFKLYGIELKCHTLDDGQRVIENPDEFFSAMFNSAIFDEDAVDPDELARFEAWRNGGSPKPDDDPCLQ